VPEPMVCKLAAVAWWWRVCVIASDAKASLSFWRLLGQDPASPEVACVLHVFSFAGWVRIKR
jgi:hypothetical protein